MRREKLYLSDMLEAGHHIGQFLGNATKEAFVDSELLKSAVLQKLLVIGEAAARLTPELKRANPHIPWSDIVGFRNVAVHAYFSMDWDVVWATAAVRVPELNRWVEAILAEFEGS